MAAIDYYRSINRYKPRGKLCVIVVRFDSDGNFMESKPCIDCIKAMTEFGVHSVKYSTSDGTIVTRKLKHIDSTESNGFKTMRTIYGMAKEFIGGSGAPTAD